jgi:hypothetical protein
MVDSGLSATVFVLGAGFSRAIHAPMPLQNELGQQLAERVLSSTRHRALLPDRVEQLLVRGQMPGGNLETWLTSLACTALKMRRQKRLTWASSF